MLQILDPPGHRRQGELPFADRFRIPGVPRRHELRQVPVAGRGDVAVLPEQIQLHALGAAEVAVHPVVVAALVISGFRILLRKLRVQREEIPALPAGPRQPGEMVDARHGGVQILPDDARDSLLRLQHGAEQLLGPEHLMAAAEGLDLREDMIQRPHAEGHGVGVVDDPRVRRVIPDRLGDFHIHGDRAHRAHESAGADRVAHRLIDAHPLRQVHIALHFLKGRGQDGNHDEVRPRQRFLQASADFIFPAGHRVRMRADPVADHLVPLRRGPVDIIQPDRSAHVPVHRQVLHKAPGPAAGTAADVGHLQFLHSLRCVHLHILPVLIAGPVYHILPAMTIARCGYFYGQNFCISPFSK